MRNHAYGLTFLKILLSYYTIGNRREKIYCLEELITKSCRMDDFCLSVYFNNNLSEIGIRCYK